MGYDPEIHHRQSIRLKEFDYSRAEYYFVTVCTQNRECMFGEIINGQMKLNSYGEIVDMTWHDLINHNPGIRLDEFVILPNHIHGIIVGAGSKSALNRESGAEIERAGWNQRE